jgi:2-methylcitrate dehydratase PrpD
MSSPDQSLPPLTAILADVGARIRFEDLPEDVVSLARQCILDWTGVALAGSSEPLSTLLLDEITGQGGNEQATLIGMGRKASMQQAALFNGAASHALDYDDVNTAMSGHPTVPVLPAVLALAEWRHATGKDLVAAFVAGFETECRLGLLMNPGHYAKGWHATGTLGTFGATAACASLMGLDAEQWQHALGIAAAQAAGLKSMFGTMCKPFHAGKAAANGLLAASLAARGFTSNPEAIETHQGFAATQAPATQLDRFLAGPEEGFAIRSVLFKYHAACYGTHSAIEGILRLRAEHDLRPGDVAAVHLRVPEAALSMCNIQEPATALEGKFSLRFTAALALASDDTGEAAFTDARVNEPALRSILHRVSVTGDPALAGGTAVTLDLADGRSLEAQVDVNIPAADLDLQWRRLASKFSGLSTPVIGPERARALQEIISRLHDVGDVTEVVALCAPAPAAVTA